MWVVSKDVSNRLVLDPASTQIPSYNHPLRQPNTHTYTHTYTRTHVHTRSLCSRDTRMSSREKGGKEIETSDEAFDKELLAGLDAEELDYKKVIPIEFHP